MKDRQPTQVLANGAIRYGVYNADGTLNHYEYLKREDAPTVEGTPLNKANLLSDATAVKLWPNATTRPEDPTVNDALGKLSEGTAKVGDIAITARTDLSDAWLLCNGQYITEEQYPELFNTLRVSASAAPWNTQLLPTVTSKYDINDITTLSYANGYWFLNKHRHLYCSTDLISWIDITPSDLTRYAGTVYTATLLTTLSVHYWQGRYVALAWLEYKANSYAYAVMYTNQLQQTGWKLDYITSWYPSTATQTIYYQKLFFDGTNYYFYYSNGTYNSDTHFDDYDGGLCSVSELVDSFNPVGISRWTYKNFGTLYYVDFYDEPTGWFYLSQRSAPSSGIQGIYRTRTILGSYTATYIPVPGTSDSLSASAVLSTYTVSGDTIVASYTHTTPYKLYRSDDSGKTFTQIYSTTSASEIAFLQLVAGILCAWSSDTKIVMLFDADNISNQSIAMDTQLSTICSTHSNTIAIISTDYNSILYQDFTHSKKKLPNISPDSRSKAYIKALEE